MDYYILLSGDTEKDAMNESSHLGTRSFKVFWAGDGLKALMNISANHPEMLEEVRIINSAGGKLTIDEFLLEIDALEVRVNRD